jgi:hypothetical protein
MSRMGSALPNFIVTCDYEDVASRTFGRTMLRACSGTKILPVARNSNDATTEFDRQVHNRSPAV